MERRHQERWNTNTMADNYCCLKTKFDSLYLLPKSKKKTDFGLDNAHFFLSWKNSIPLCLGYSLHFNLFLPPPYLLYKAIVILICVISHLYLVSYSCHRRLYIS